MDCDCLLRLAVVCPIGLGDNMAVLNVLSKIRDHCRCLGRQVSFSAFCQYELSEKIFRLCPWVHEVIKGWEQFGPRAGDGEFDLFWDFRPAEEQGPACPRHWGDVGIQWSVDSVHDAGITEYSLSTRLARQNFGMPCRIEQAAELTIPPAEAEWARRLRESHLRTSRLLIAVNRRDILFKSWPAPYYDHLVRHLISDLSAAVIGTGRDRERIASEAPLFIDVVGRLTFEQFVALLSVCDGFFGVDSGPGHVAAALGLPTVIIACPPAFRRHYWRVLPTGRSITVVYPDVDCDQTCEVCADPCIALVRPEVALEAVQQRLTVGGQSKLLGVAAHSRRPGTHL